MSLINDALRRAKEAQKQAPAVPSHDLPFRPVETAQQRARHVLGLLLPVALVAVALLTLLLVWEWTRTHGTATVIEANARTARVPQAKTPAPVPAAKPAPVQELAAPPAPVTNIAPALAADNTSAADDEPLADVQESAPTNAPAIAAPPLPKLPPLRLQAIIFDPRRPSAMINGATLFIGEKVEDMQVVAIRKDSATLVGLGQTNVLSLAH
jgi:hypothetical protein